MAQNSGGFSIGAIVGSIISLAVVAIIFYAIYLFFGGTPEGMAQGLLDFGRGISEWLASFARSFSN